MALTTAQQALLLFKKWLGLGQTTASREFFNETSFPGRSAVYTNQIWTQADLIPNTAPALSNGQTSGVVQYWQTAPLGAVAGTTNAFTSSLLVDAIPFNYGDGSSYNYVIRNNIGGTIAFGEGDWIVDTDAGLLTFYSTVPANMPPTMSFYKYVGTKGFTSGSVPLTGSLFGTASFAVSASWSPIPNNIVSSSSQINTGSFSGSFIGTASFATTTNNIIGGNTDYIPLWNSTSTLSSSVLYQTQSSILLGNTTHHTPTAPDKLGVYAGVTDSYNLISGHGEVDNYFQINIKNFSGGSSASSDIVVTSDVGTETSGYADFGINSSGYLNNGNGIGTGSDAYLYVQGAGDLLIGNKSPDKRVVIFTGEGNAIDNARVYIDTSGSVAINTSIPTPGAPEALIVDALTNSYNLITARANLDNYTQINIKNLSGGNSASADIVATNNIGTETSYYIDMGINSDQYNQPGFIGGPGDAYIYSTGNMLHIGNASANQHVMFFAGGSDAEANNKLTLDANNQHSLSGSLNVTGSINVLDNVVNNLTASFAVTASYVEGAASDWSTLANKPDGIVSSSTQVQNYNVFATTGSNIFKASQTITGSLIVTDTITAQQFNIEFVSSSVIYESGSTKFGDSADDTHQFTGSLSVLGSISGSLILPIGTVSSSTQIDYNNIQNKPTTIATASYVEFTNVANKPALISSSTQVNYNQLSNLPSGIISSSTQFNALTGTSASFATTASAATSITFTPTTASFSTTSSFASTASFVNTLNQNVSASGNIEAGTNLRSNFSSGDEGGEINLARPQTNTSISGSVVIDVNGNRVRIFEANLPNRGGYYDITSLAAGVGTNLAGGGGTVTSITAGNGLTGGTITGVGTITLDTSSAHFITGSVSVLNLKNVVSSSTQINTGSFTGSFVGQLTGTSSWASNAITASAATSITFTPVTASFATTASAATSITFTPSSASFATTSSFASNARLLNNTGSGVFATTGSNSFNGTQTITGSLLLTTDIVVFSGSFTTSGSFAVTGSLGVTSGITGSLLGSSSFATTASAATSITFTPTTASFSTTSSFASTTPFSGLTGVPTLVSNSAQIDVRNTAGITTLATTGSNVFVGNQRITGSLILSSSAITELQVIGNTEMTGSLSFILGGVTGSLFGTSSWAQNVTSASFATTASAATSITFTPSSASFSTTSSFATTASAATSITFTPTSASFATTASAATSITFTPTSASFATTASAATSITFTPVTSSYALTASFIDGGFY